jgi:glycosyltransferase involved in cell wall biosynthesis
MLCSDTAPVREVITDSENGLLCDFFDDAAFAERALEVLADPAGHRERLGRAAERTVAERYALDVTFPTFAGFLDEVAAG